MRFHAKRKLLKRKVGVASLSDKGDSVVAFIFSCLVPSSIVFLVLQKPWKGRPLPNSQVIPTVINGGIMALYYTLWGKGLLSCGPLVALIAEYAGAILGVLSAALYGRRVWIWKKSSLKKSRKHSAILTFWWTRCNDGIILFLIKWVGYQIIFAILYPNSFLILNILICGTNASQVIAAAKLNAVLICSL
uniref:Uncharacterized protein n=1 Tax=Ananas comosus var. bracteatus TaxID=296719 RepID=A0A6V7QBB6_ANACO|nr:unnamed protein product [Ananas comosus var. bracteatus]